MRITVSVTQDDIDAGVAGNCHMCPVALAVRRLFPGQRVQVGATLIVVRGQGFEMSPRVAGFVSDFDAGRPGRPFTFDLRVPRGMRLAVAGG